MDWICWMWSSILTTWEPNPRSATHLPVEIDIVVAMHNHNVSWCLENQSRWMGFQKHFPPRQPAIVQMWQDKLEMLAKQKWHDLGRLVHDIQGTPPALKTNSVTQRNNQNNPSNNQSQSVNQTKSKKNYAVVHPQNHHPIQAVRCVLARQNFAAGARGSLPAAGGRVRGACNCLHHVDVTGGIAWWKPILDVLVRLQWLQVYQLLGVAIFVSVHGLKKYYNFLGFLERNIYIGLVKN